ncbi:TonB-dependent receptor [Pseudomonadales bacterium]|nr:TonB-dependent receptor [Pseudomonadales bacterium]
MKPFNFTAALLLSTIPFNLQAQSHSLMEEVIVGASHIPIAISQSANAVTVINREKIKNRAALSVSDLLRDVPGLAVSRSGVLGSATQIRVRGSEANHLLVLIDGVEANDPSQSDELNWGTLAASDIERIEIIRGPQSAMYGSDAVAGIVNIITRRADKPLNASVYSEAGSWATRKNGFTIGQGNNEYDIRLGVSHLESDGENISRSGNEKDGHKNTSVNLTAGWNIDDQIRLSLVARQNDGMSAFDADSDFDGFIEDQDRVSEFRNSTVGLQGDYDSVDGRLKHKVVIAQSKNNNDNFSDGLLGNSSSATKDQFKYVGSLFWDDSAQRASLLLEHEDERFNQTGPFFSGENAGQDLKRTTDSVALEYRVDVTDSLTLTASGRYDDNSEFDSAETLRFEASYQASDSTRLRSAWGTAVKNPTFTERFAVFGFFVGNPDLIPEESTSWEFGIDHALLGGDINLGATIFNAELENEINGFAPAGGGNSTAVNKEGRSQRQGVELTVLSTLSDSLSMDAAYTYIDSVEFDSNSGQDVDETRRPRHSASLNIAWQAADKLQLNANVQYSGGQTDVFFPPWPSPSQTVSLDKYTLLNLNANYSATQQLDMYVRLDNVLDDQYEEVFSYQTLGFGGSVGFRLKFH